MAEKLNIGIIGAGRWARSAHLPGFTRSPLSEVVAICDLNRELAESRAEEFGVDSVYTDYREMLRKEELDVVDVCTRGSFDDRDNHERLVFAVLEAGKHCLCEKPVAHDYRNVWKAHRLAESKGLKTKVGLTFRYSAAMMYMKELISEGFIGEPFIFNGFEQNSQFISPDKPVTKADLIPATVSDELKAGSLEGYGAPIIDISLWFIGSDLMRVIGLLKNFVPYRTNRDGERMRTNIDDGDIYIGEYANGAMCSVQSSYVTVGNYPGLEARAYGSEGALICQLSGHETLHSATPEAVEFVPVEIPERLFCPGHKPEELPYTYSNTDTYTNLVHNFNEEIISGGEENQGNFAQSARVQEIINAVELSHRESRWVNLPLDQ